MFGGKRKLENESKSKSTKKMQWDDWVCNSWQYKKFENTLKNYIRINDPELHKELERTDDYSGAFGLEFLIRFVCVEKHKTKTFKFISMQNEDGRDKMNLVFLIIMQGFHLNTLCDLGYTYSNIRNRDDWLSNRDVQTDFENLTFGNQYDSVLDFIEDWKNNKKNYTWKCEEVLKICDNIGFELNDETRFDTFDVQKHLDGHLSVIFKEKLCQCETIETFANMNLS